jgi:WD40 repeat protein
VLFAAFAHKGRAPAPPPKGFAAYCATCHAGALDLAVSGQEPRDEECLAAVREAAPALPAALAPDGQTLAAAGSDGRVRLWDLATGRATQRLEPGPVGEVAALAFSPDGRHLAVCGSRDLSVWDLAERREVRRFGAPGPAGMGRGAAVFSPGGDLLAASGAGRIRVWDLSTGRERRRVEGKARESSALEFSPDGKLLAWAAADGTLRLDDALSGREVWRLRMPEGAPDALTFAPDGRTLAAAGAGRVTLWDVVEGREVCRLAAARTPAGALAFSADGRFLAAAESQGRARLWEVATGKECLAGRPGSVAGLALSPSDGQVLAAAGVGGCVHFWDTRTGEELDQRPGRSLELVSAALTPDGRSLLPDSPDATRLVWDVVGLRPEEVAENARCPLFPTPP